MNKYKVKKIAWKMLRYTVLFLFINSRTLMVSQLLQLTTLGMSIQIEDDSLLYPCLVWFLFGNVRDTHGFRAYHQTNK